MLAGSLVSPRPRGYASPPETQRHPPGGLHSAIKGTRTTAKTRAVSPRSHHPTLHCAPLMQTHHPCIPIGWRHRQRACWSPETKGREPSGQQRARVATGYAGARGSVHAEQGVLGRAVAVLTHTHLSKDRQTGPGRLYPSSSTALPLPH